MTAIRAWNGAAWVQPKFRTPKGWERYEVPTFVPAKTEWSFDSDNEGWQGLNDGIMGPTPWDPSGALVLNGGTNSITTYCPMIDESEGSIRGDRYYAGITVKALNIDTTTNNTFRNKIDIFVSIQMIGEDYFQHEFTYAGETVDIVTDPEPLEQLDGLLSVNVQKYPDTTMVNHILAAWIRREDGAPIGVQTESPVKPKYWDGSAWVPQNAV